MKIFISVLLVLLTVAVAANAERTSNIKVVGEEQNCKLQSTGTVNINFNDVGSDILRLKSILDEKIKAIEDMAKEAGVATIELQSLNYNANSQSSGGCSDNPTGGFQTNANIGFNIKPADNAAAFAALLVKKGYNTSFNVNAYRQCGGFEGGE